MYSAKWIRSSREGSRARDHVRRRRRVRVDADRQALVRGRVRRHRHLRRVARPAAGDGDLRARRVPLRGTGDVQADLLDLHEILW
jgi:hypothetical protein